VSGCAAGDTRVMHFWGFPLYRPLDGKRSFSNVSTAIENQKLSVQA